MHNLNGKFKNLYSVRNIPDENLQEFPQAESE